MRDVLNIILIVLCIAAFVILALTSAWKIGVVMLVIMLATSVFASGNDDRYM